MMCSLCGTPATTHARQKGHALLTAQPVKLGATFLYFKTASMHLCVLFWLLKPCGAQPLSVLPGSWPWQGGRRAVKCAERGRSEGRLLLCAHKDTRIRRCRRDSAAPTKPPRAPINTQAVIFLRLFKSWLRIKYLCVSRGREWERQTQDSNAAINNKK